MQNTFYFADEEGNLFNQYFEYVSKEQLRSKEPSLHKKTTVLPTFPTTSQYEKYHDYEKAVLEWTNDIQHSFEQIKLPNVMGSYFLRPFLSSQIIEESVKKQQSLKNKKESITEKIVDQTTVEKNRTSQLREKRMLSSNNHRELQKEINKNLNYLEDTELIISNDSSWQTKLIPKEPDPYEYSEYIKYERAYQNWSKIVQKTVNIPIPHANEFGKLYGVMSNEKKKKYAEERKLLKENIRASSGNKDLNSKNSKKGMQNNNIKTTHFEWIKKLNLKLFTSSTKERKLGIFYLSQDYYSSLCEEIKPKIAFFQKGKIKNPEKESNSNEQMQKRNEEIKKDTGEAIQKHFLKIKGIYQKIDLNKSIKDIGILHGTFPHESLSTPKIYYDTNPLSCFSLKRGDLGGIMLLKGLDCMPVIDKKQVQFILPNYDFNNAIELRKLRDPINNHYVNNKRNYLRDINKENRLQRFYTWYYPKIYSHQKCEFDKFEIVRQFNLQAGQLINDRLSSVFITNAKFDTFKELLDEEVLGNNPTFFDTLYSLLSQHVGILNNLYLLFFDHNSDLIHYKLSYFLIALFKSGKINNFIENYIQNYDLVHLSYLTYGCNYFNTSFNYLFLMKDEIQYYSKILFKNDYWHIEKNILIHHYLMVLLKIFENLDFKNKANQKTFLNKLINTIQSNLKSKKKQFANFFNTHIYAGIKNRSTKISGYYSFLFICLLQFCNKDIIDLLFNSNLNFLNDIIELSKSKFSHVKHSIKVIWKLLIKNDIIRQFLINNFISQKKTFFFKQLVPQFSNEIESVLFKNNLNNNIINTEKDNSKNNNNNINGDEGVNDRIFPTCLLNLINESMLQIKLVLIHNEESIDNKKRRKKLKKSNVMESLNDYNSNDLFFLTNDFFSLLIDLFYWLLIKKQKNYTLYDNLSFTINNISKIFKKIRNYQNNNNNNQNQNKNNKNAAELIKKIKMQCNKMCIDLNRINYLFEIIKKLNDKRLNSKMLLLKVINHLIRSEPLFKKINQNPKFFSDLNTIIRSNSDLNVIDQACEIIHTFILSHPRGINYLIDTKQLRSFVSHVGSNSDISTFAYGLHIFYKLFNLYDRQFSKQKRKKKLKRCVGLGKKNILTTIKDDHETFIAYFSKNSLFVKLNMLFQKHLNNVNSNNVSGLILSSLAKVYSIILFQDYCTAILITNQKKKQYQDGINFFQKMIYGNIPEKFWYQVASVGKEQKPKHIAEKIEEVKNDLMGILDDENDITFDNESSGQDLEPTNLEKRAKHKIKKFQENLGSKKEEEKEKQQKQKQRKKQEQKKNNSKSQTQKRHGFISFQEFKEQKDTEIFKQQIKSLNKITNEDYDDDFDFSDSDSNSSSLNSEVSSSEEEETNNSLSQLRNKFSGIVNDRNSNSSESDPFSDESENSEKEDFKVKESLKAQKKKEDSEDDEFSDF
ncbi:sca1 complex scaffold protein scaa [Anaeramoeba flamelloides]|uniref:Sca1 complex scaffold protein scaa n=1 Tax=Anaeramoeba flamelloides TaxID=1746091 RepID=A0ABQ8Y6H8_9EUKA|nr:sca1 complex scaffold protein scaa [Anaeramoeba flamelloides]